MQDAIDMRILRALQDNGRLSNQDLADQVALSPSACLRRVRTLEEEGLIRAIAPSWMRWRWASSWKPLCR
jgi:DNA-binding Lrp family transcriptional regulator